MMTSPKKVLEGLVLLVAVLVIGITAAVAMAAPAPKTTGGIGYTAYSDVQRHLSFVAIQSKTDTCGRFWNVTGVDEIDFVYNSVTYHHTATLTQNGQSLGGTGGYKPAAVQENTWVVNAGTGSTVVGNAFSLDATYTDPAGVAGIPLVMSGTIAANGSIEGTFSQSAGVTGTFRVPEGSATAYATYCGKGNAYYSDADDNSYFVNVKAVTVDGADAWFAGEVIWASTSSWVGQWLFVKVNDGGEPGKLVDNVWGSFATEAAALAGVGAKATPADGQFTITSGNLQVH